MIDRVGGADLAAEMLGHTSSEITKQHYIEPDQKVNPVTAEISKRSHLVQVIDYRARYVPADHPLLLPRENGRGADRHSVRRILNNVAAAAGIGHHRTTTASPARGRCGGNCTEKARSWARFA